MWAAEAYSRILGVFSVDVGRKTSITNNLRASASSIYRPEHGNQKVEGSEVGIPWEALRLREVFQRHPKRGRSGFEIRPS